MRHVDRNKAPYVPTATLVQLRQIVGDLVEAVDQLDMARESGGVISDDLITRLRGYLAEPADHQTEGGV